jgi:hypothetical protein
MTKKKHFLHLELGVVPEIRTPQHHHLELVLISGTPCSSGITQLQSTRSTRISIMKIIERKKIFKNSLCIG